MNLWFSLNVLLSKTQERWNPRRWKTQPWSAQFLMDLLVHDFSAYSLVIFYIFSVAIAIRPLLPLFSFFLSTFCTGGRSYIQRILYPVTVEATLAVFLLFTSRSERRPDHRLRRDNTSWATRDKRRSRIPSGLHETMRTKCYLSVSHVKTCRYKMLWANLSMAYATLLTLGLFERYREATLDYSGG